MDEVIVFEFEFINGEDIEVLVKFDVILFGENFLVFIVDIVGYEFQILFSFCSEESKLIGVFLGIIESFKILLV